VNILVLGDSSANQGMATDYIMKSTGLTALNLATEGSAIAVNDYWMLEDYIDRVGLPDCVIIGHVYDLWDRHINYPLIAQIPVDGSSIRDRLGDLPYNHAAKFSAQLKYLIAKYFRAVSENQSMKRLLIRPWSAQESSPIILSESGFYAAHGAQPEKVTDDANGHLERVRTRIFKASLENRYSLTKMVNLANKHKFRLYFINSPLYQGLYEDEYLKRYLTSVNAFISDATNQSDYATHLFSTPITYGDHEMQNVDHLIAGAAEHFTQKVIEKIDCAAPAVR
jgi:hypothetical protein